MAVFVLSFVLMLMPVQDPLAAYQWKNRLIVIAYDQETAHIASTQKKYLQNEHAGRAERKLLMVEMARGTGRVSNGKKLNNAQCGHIRATYKIPSKGFHVLLIGLDGAEKMRSEKALPAADFYRLIDAMPMRRNGR